MIDPVSRKYIANDIAIDGFNVNVISTGPRQFYFKHDGYCDYIVEIYGNGSSTTYWLVDRSSDNDAGFFYQGKFGYRLATREEFIDYLNSSGHQTADWFLFHLDILK